MVLGEVLLDDIADLFVAETAGGDKEALSRRLGDLEGPYVRQRQVAHIGPDVRAGRGKLIPVLALYQIADSLVGGVEGAKGVKIVNDGAQD